MDQAGARPSSIRQVLPMARARVDAEFWEYRFQVFPMQHIQSCEGPPVTAHLFHCWRIAPPPRIGEPSPTSALWCEEPLENQGPVDFSVTMRLASLPGFYWTYD